MHIHMNFIYISVHISVYFACGPFSIDNPDLICFKHSICLVFCFLRNGDHLMYILVHTSIKSCRMLIRELVKLKHRSLQSRLEFISHTLTAYKILRRQKWRSDVRHSWKLDDCPFECLEILL